MSSAKSEPLIRKCSMLRIAVGVMVLMVALGIAGLGETGLSDTTRGPASDGRRYAGGACCASPPSRFGSQGQDQPQGMVWIPGGVFTMGTSDSEANARPVTSSKIIIVRSKAIPASRLGRSRRGAA